MKHTSEALKPCPFCGGIAALLLPTCKVSDEYDPLDRLYPLARCAAAGCHAEAYGTNEDYKGKSAVTAWNRRAGSDPSAVRELVEALTDALYEFAPEGDDPGLPRLDWTKIMVDLVVSDEVAQSQQTDPDAHLTMICEVQIMLTKLRDNVMPLLARAPGGGDDTP